MSRTFPRRASAAPVRRLHERARAAVAAVALAVALGGFGGAPLSGQSLVDPILPGGMVGLGIVPSHSTWSSIYGPDGVQPLGADLTSTNAATLFPGITTLEQNLRSLTGSPTGFPSILGPVSSSVSKGVDRLEFRARLGVFNWLTLGVMLPMVRSRIPIDTYYQPDSLQANIGVSPAVTGNDGVSTLVTQLGDAASAATDRANTLCTANPSGADCSSATALAQRVTRFENATQSAYYSSPFFPREGSAAATALTHALAALNQDLRGAGLDSVPAAFVFAAGAVTADEFNQIPGNPSAGIRATPLKTVDGLWQMGDVELTAMIRLLKGEVRDSGAANPRFSWELAGGGLIRLGTGHPANPDVLFDVGSGDGQTDFEGRLYGALRVGSHIGLRSTARYGIQRSVVQLRRVTPPGRVLAPYSSLQAVRWSPGSYLYLQVSPRWYLSQGFSLTFDYDYYTKGADGYATLTTSQGSAPALDASVLEQQTAMTLQQVGFGLTYSSLRGARSESGVLPVEFDARFIQAIGGSGRAPQANRFQIALRAFHRLWGGS